MLTLEERIRALRSGARVLAATSDSIRKQALESIASALEERRAEIEDANCRDIERAKKDGLSDALLHRLKFSGDKIESAVKGLREPESSSVE